MCDGNVPTDQVMVAADQVLCRHPREKGLARLPARCSTHGGLRVETLALDDRVVQFRVGIADFLGRHKQFEAFGDTGLGAMPTRARRFAVAQRSPNATTTASAAWRHVF